MAGSPSFGRPSRAGIAAVGITLLAACSGFSPPPPSLHGILNRTGMDLVPYPVVTNPPPPHREADPSGSVPHDGVTGFDPLGFNPIYYGTGADLNPDGPNALYLGLALEDTPAIVQWKVMHYPVEPGQEGNDPALQPKTLDQGIVEVDPSTVFVVVQSGPDPTDPWKVEIKSK